MQATFTIEELRTKVDELGGDELRTRLRPEIIIPSAQVRRYREERAFVAAAKKILAERGETLEDR